jgi:hypothetical protein
MVYLQGHKIPRSLIWYPEIVHNWFKHKGSYIIQLNKYKLIIYYKKCEKYTNFVK